jgi:MoaA/NifB/PqqE/SkfB family radical SAM enzyme
MNKKLVRLIGKGLSFFLKYDRLVEVSSKLSLPLAPPFSASVQITLHCNSRCSYCDIWRLLDKRQVSSKMMQIDDLDRIFKSFRRLGVRTVSLTGGEPLTRDDLSAIVHLAVEDGLSPDICTNGVSLTNERALELAEAGTKCIILSLDTLDPEAYQEHRGVSFRFAKRALGALLNVVEKHPSTRCNINCVVTRHNIGQLVAFTEQISKYGKGQIAVNLQPFHRPPDFMEVACGLPEEMKERLRVAYDHPQSDNLTPDYSLKPAFEEEIERLITLKRKGFPVANSEQYLRRMPDFLFDNRLPSHFKCLAGYTSMVVRYDSKLLPCWRLPPIGNLSTEELDSVWFSKRYAERRKNMEKMKCQGCMLICHNEPSLYECP